MEGEKMKENLEIMSHAKNYNHYIASLIVNYAKNCQTLLDFGAGIGTIAKEVKSLLSHVDILCVEHDQELMSQIPREFPVFQSLEDIEKPVDFIYAVNVLEHIEKDRWTLLEFFKILKPNGGLFIWVPAHSWLWSSMDFQVGHVRRYSKKELIQKVKTAGFEVINCRYEDPIGLIASMGLKFTNSISLSKVKLYDRYIFPISKKLGHAFGKNISLYAKKIG
jgi:SAM-dependent methyltransferase